MSSQTHDDFQYLIATVALTALLVVAVSVSNLAGDLAKLPVIPVADRVEQINPYMDPQSHARESRLAEADRRFQQAVMMFHAKQYDMAIKALHRVLELTPTMPEAHSNMGYALLNTGEYKIAYDFFVSATELRPMFDNAYYGMALALEGVGQYEGAIGAMRTYLHLAADENFRAKAEEYIAKWRRLVDEVDRESE